MKFSATLFLATLAAPLLGATASPLHEAVALKVDADYVRALIK